MTGSSVTGNLWPIGVVIVIAASVGSNGGINFQKVSIMRELRKPKQQQRPFPLQPLWLLGFIAVVLGAIGDFLGLAFAPQSLLIPLGGTSLVANIWCAGGARVRGCAAALGAARHRRSRRAARPALLRAPFCRFARWCLGERASRREYISTIFLVIGVIMICITGSKESLTYDLAGLAVLFAAVRVARARRRRRRRLARARARALVFDAPRRAFSAPFLSRRSPPLWATSSSWSRPSSRCTGTSCTACLCGASSGRGARSTTACSGRT